MADAATGSGVPQPEPDNPAGNASSIARSFAEMARVMLVPGSLARTRDQIVQQAVLALDCEHAALLALGSGRRVRVLATTSDVISELVTLERRTREGPGLQVLLGGGTVRVDDLGSDERWPRFGDVAAKLGLRSMLGCELSTDRRRLGALCLYGERPATFPAEAEELAAVYAAHASLVLDSVRVESELTEAVESRQVIGQAVGILVERHRITTDQAFDMLVRASKNRNIKIRDLADLLIETGAEPAAVPVPSYLSAGGGARSDDRSGDDRGEEDSCVRGLADGSAGFKVVGEVDLSNWDQLQAALDMLPPTSDDVVLDLSELAFIDVASVRSLLRGADKIGVENRRVILRDAPPVLRRVLGVLVGCEVPAQPEILLPWHEPQEN